jgi:diguanylate cyclase (GGDEF)-like protein
MTPPDKAMPTPSPLDPSDTRLPERLWRRIMQWMSMDDGYTLLVNHQRKIAQTNLAALMAMVTSAAVGIAFWVNGNAALAWGAWLDLPFVFLYSLVWYFNRQGWSYLACWTLFLLMMANVLLGILCVHGIALSAHYYFLAFAVVAPMVFSARQWRSAGLLLLLNLGLFFALDWGEVPALPDLAQIDATSLALIRKGIVGTCVILVAILLSVSEYSAALSEWRLQQLATSDALTGLPNRLALRQAFTHELARRKREWQPMSFAMADIDFFKRVNDEWGHDAGDLALCHISAVLRGQARADEVVARMGGEEFGVILLTDPKNAELAAQRMCRAIEAAPFEYGGKRRTITISIGLAHMTPTDDAQSALRLADEALYQAKHQGRNQVVVARGV